MISRYFYKRIYMRYLKVVIVLLLISGPLMAEKSQNIVEMEDFDESLQGFSLSEGDLVKMSAEADSFPPEIDFIFDMPHGIGANNSELDSFFSGNALIKALGMVPIEEPADLSDEGFTLYLEPDQIIPGHSYLIKSSDGSQYGMIRILGFDPENGRLKFEWVMQS